MKKAIFLASILLSTQAFANTCTSSWDLYVGNAPVGRMSDVISKKGNDVEIVSSYTPTGLAALFNVKKITRLVKFQNSNLVLRQEEVHSSGKKEISMWSKNGQHTWEKIINGVTKDSISILNSHLTIDSTSLPYIFQLGMSGKRASNQTVNVISKNKAYEGTVSIESVNDDPIKKLKIFFKTDRTNGTIYYNSEGKPIEMLFSDPKINFTGYITENNCGVM